MRNILPIMLVLLLQAGMVFAQDRTIAGRVTDARDGAPMQGVTITGKGSNVYTQSGPDGEFRITVPSYVSVLIFSAVGFGTTEIAIGDRKQWNIALTLEGKNLDEVVVVGYGTQRKAEVTGASGTVTSKEIANVPRTSVDQILQGKVAGLQSVTPSGQPGSIQQLRIRGIGSITAGAAPLWVVDGVPINIGDVSRATTTSNLIAGLNPNDIEEITVLKDAAATSIYGSRAANGVILVTTKKGRAGKSQIKVETELGYADLANIPDAGKPLNAAEWLELLEEGLTNAGYDQSTIDFAMDAYGANTGVDTDWLGLVSRRGKQQQLNISASGGNDKSTYYLSAGYFNQEAPIIASDFRRYSATMNLSNKFSNRVKVNTNFSASTVRQNTPLNGGLFGNPMDAVYFLRPMQNPYNPDGTLNYSKDGLTDFPADYNPLWIAEHDRKRFNNFKILGNISAEVKILDNLKFTSRYGVDYFNLEENLFDNPFHGDGDGVGGRAYFFYTKIFNWVFTNQLDFRQPLFGADSDIYLDAKLGYEAQQSKEIEFDSYKEGFPPTTELNYPTVGATPVYFEGTGSDYTFASVFSALTFNYKNKYVLTGSFRRDGSSRFGINNRYGNFWSVGAAWNLHLERFMENVNFISTAKLRTSYGVNGNGDLENYSWRPLFAYGANYNGQPGGSFSNIGNIDLTWELNKPFDIGLELGFLNNRLNLVVDYYKRVTSDLLLERPLSRVTGFEEILQNVGAMQNAGVEITIDGVPVTTRDFTWNTSFNIAFNKNKITELPGGEFADGAYYRKEGYDYQSWYTRLWAGVDPDNGDPLWYSDETKSATTNDYGAAQRVIYGTATPKYFGSFNNTFRYRGFALDLQFYFSMGNYVRDAWGTYAYDGFNPTSNKYKRNLERWQKPGQITDVPRYEYGLQNFSSQFSTRLLYKGDFIRLRNITLSYSLPRKVLQKAGLGVTTFYVRGFNLLTKTFDDRLTFDPENGITSTSNLNIPINKTVTFGLTVEL